MFINELFASIHLFWVQKICLGYLRDKGVLEIYGMVNVMQSALKSSGILLRLDR